MDFVALIDTVQDGETCAVTESVADAVTLTDFVDDSEGKALAEFDEEVSAVCV